jgi:KaiC/GvpD/RAD55 family RecA-like ATPase
VTPKKRSRVHTGVDGVDDMIDGGIPEANQVLLAGGPGSGKTLFGFEYLYKNALEGHTGVLFSFEEDSDRILQNATDAFNEFTEINRLVSEKKLIIYGAEQSRTYMSKGEDKPRFAFGEMVTQIESMVSAADATRVVIDSVSILKLFIKDPFEYRDLSIGLVSMLRRMQLTSILTMEIESSEKSGLLFQPEFFVYDGIVVMYSTGGNGESRTPAIEVIKMRGSKHSFMTVPYEITSNGINLLLLAGRNRDR